MGPNRDRNRNRVSPVLHCDLHCMNVLDSGLDGIQLSIMLLAKESIVQRSRGCQDSQVDVNGSEDQRLSRCLEKRPDKFVAPDWLHIKQCILFLCAAFLLFNFLLCLSINHALAFAVCRAPAGPQVLTLSADSMVLRTIDWLLSLPLRRSR